MVKLSKNAEHIRLAGYRLKRLSTFGCYILEVSPELHYLMPGGVQCVGVSKANGKYNLVLSYRSRMGVEKFNTLVHRKDDFDKEYSNLLGKVSRFSEDGRRDTSSLPFKRSTSAKGDLPFNLNIDKYRIPYRSSDEACKVIAECLRENFLIMYSRQVLADVVSDNLSRLEINTLEMASLLGVTEASIRDYRYGRYQTPEITKVILDNGLITYDSSMVIKAVVESRPHPKVLYPEVDFWNIGNVGIVGNPLHGEITYEMSDLSGKVNVMSAISVKSHLAYLFRQMRNATAVTPQELIEELDLNTYTIQHLENGEGTHRGLYMGDIILYLRKSVHERDSRLHQAINYYIDQYVTYREQYLKQHLLLH